MGTYMTRLEKIGYIEGIFLGLRTNGDKMELEKLVARMMQSFGCTRQYVLDMVKSYIAGKKISSYEEDGIVWLK